MNYLTVSFSKYPLNSINFISRYWGFPQKYSQISFFFWANDSLSQNRNPPFWDDRDACRDIVRSSGLSIDSWSCEHEKVVFLLKIDIWWYTMVYPSFGPLRLGSYWFISLKYAHCCWGSLHKFLVKLNDNSSWYNLSLYWNLSHPVASHPHFW
jgi:hypothetical protein